MAPSVTKAPLGSGGRFKALMGKLENEGADNPRALAAFIGRKKYGKKRFAQIRKGKTYG